MRIAFDTNCFINAVHSDRREYPALQKILTARDASRLRIAVSQHSLHQLEEKPDEALVLARTAEVLPNYPFGSWDDLVGSWDTLAGTWDDIAKTDALRAEIKRLAKAGADIRDVGACIDALHAGVDFFVTADTELCGSGPAKRIAARFGLTIVTATELANRYDNIL